MMAISDYRLCDVCGMKCFYDSELQYDFEEYKETGLWNLGNWICLCRACSTTHEIKIEKKPSIQLEDFTLPPINLDTIGKAK